MASLPVALAAPRTWTGADGRTLEAEMVARTATEVTLKRATDGKQFTLPLAGFSEGDRAWVAASDVAITKPVDVAKLKELQNSIPKLRVNAPLDQTCPACVQVFDRYSRAIAHIKPETIAQNLKNIRDDLARDLKVFQSVAATQVKNPPMQLPTGGWTTGSGAWGDVWSARSNVAWLNGPLTTHLSRIEELIN